MVQYLLVVTQFVSCTLRVPTHLCCTSMLAPKTSLHIVEHVPYCMCTLLKCLRTMGQHGSYYPQGSKQLYLVLKGDQVIMVDPI